MAKAGSFSSRFPHFKLFLFLAVVIALPLTVFSANKVSTNSDQHAAVAATCSSVGGGCVSSGRDCASGFTNPLLSCVSGVCCVPAPKTPYNLSASSKCHYYADAENAAYFSFHWTNLPNVTKYNIYLLITDKRGYYAQSFNFYPTSSPYNPAAVSLNHNVLAKWRIRAYYPGVAGYGPYSNYQSIPLSC